MTSRERDQSNSRRENVKKIGQKIAPSKKCNLEENDDKNDIVDSSSPVKLRFKSGFHLARRPFSPRRKGTLVCKVSDEA